MPVVALELNSSGAVTGLKQYANAAELAGKETDSLTGKNKKAGSSFGRLVGSIGGVATAVAGLGALVAGSVAVGFAKMAVTAASDLEEVQNKFDVVFRGMSEQATAWGATLQASYFMSETESKKFLSSVQDLLVPMGMARGQAAGMSFEVTKLAADLGSFNNLPTAQVMDDMQSALVGNYETMKKYGVVLNATNVQQEALNMGLAKNKDELTAAHKAQAAYSLMVKGSSDAIGDMERSSGSYANQMKKLKAQLSDVTAQLGGYLLPYATALISKFNTWLESTNGLTKQLLWLVEGARFLYNGFQGLVLAGDAVVVGFAYVFDFLAKGLRMLLFPIDKLFAGLQKLGAIENNPFDQLIKGSEMFKESSKDVLKGQVQKIEQSNAAFDRLRAKIEQNGQAMAKKKQATAQAIAVDNVAKQAVDGLTDSQQRLNDTMGNQIPQAAARAVSALEAVAQAAANANAASSVYMGSEAYNDATSSKGMDGHKTAMELAYGGGSSTVNVNVSQKVTRSDVVGIVNDILRQSNRA